MKVGVLTAVWVIVEEGQCRTDCEALGEVE